MKENIRREAMGLVENSLRNVTRVISRNGKNGFIKYKVSLGVHAIENQQENFSKQIMKTTKLTRSMEKTQPKVSKEKLKNL
ncbi:hypothetical protein JTB14_030551 [Gonioctena quinquepunctata]|nr:hypothetical protein JTB14_030551 [Gonioctena quinquepunctata]